MAALWERICKKLPVCPQKGLFLRMGCQNLPVCPQKEAFLRMDYQEWRRRLYVRVAFPDLVVKQDLNFET